MPSTELATTEIIEINPPQSKALQPAPGSSPEAPRKPYLCRHIFVDGHQCGSRALRTQHFCYYHYAHRTPVLAHPRRRPPASGFHLTRLDGLDNHTAIQLAISDVLGHIAENTVDPKRAWLLLYGLQIAGNNLRRARPNPEAPIPDTIIEEAHYGQLAAVEQGRIVPPSLHDQMCALLEKDPNADLNKFIEEQDYPVFPIPDVQT